MKFRFSHIVPNRIHHIALLFLILIGFPLAGCSTFLAWTVPTAGVAALQERSIGDSVDDLTIRAELNQIFFEDNVELLQSVSFTVLEGRVLLKGAVEKPEDRIHSVKLAWQASGVREVINEIQVTDQGGIVNFARDTWISTQLKADIMFDSNIVAINYNIETVNGVIYLAGIAQEQAEIDKVVDYARRIKHVNKVVSHVILKDDPRRTPGP